MNAQNSTVLQVQPAELVTSRGDLAIPIVSFVSAVDCFGSIISRLHFRFSKLKIWVDLDSCK